MNINTFDMTIFQLKNFKTQIMAKTKALVYHRLYDSMAERIKPTALNISTFCETSSNPVRGRFFIIQRASHNP